MTVALRIPGQLPNPLLECPPAGHWSVALHHAAAAEPADCGGLHAHNPPHPVRMPDVETP